MTLEGFATLTRTRLSVRRSDGLHVAEFLFRDKPVRFEVTTVSKHKGQGKKKKVKTLELSGHGKTVTMATSDLALRIRGHVMVVGTNKFNTPYFCEDIIH